VGVHGRAIRFDAHTDGDEEHRDEGQRQLSGRGSRSARPTLRARTSSPRSVGSRASGVTAEVEHCEQRPLKMPSPANPRAHRT
jgi:hypothetical protein